LPTDTIQITFIHHDGTRQNVTASENQSVMQIALENNISTIEGICGGSLACATCHVYIPDQWKRRVEAQDNEQSEEEIDMLELAKNTKTTSRLACQIKLTTALNGLTIFLPQP